MRLEQHVVGALIPLLHGSTLRHPVPEDRTYVVKKGDTPVAIARQFGVSVDELLKTNNITDPRSLQVGQTLKVPTPPGH